MVESSVSEMGPLELKLFETWSRGAEIIFFISTGIYFSLFGLY